MIEGSDSIYMKKVFALVIMVMLAYKGEDTNDRRASYTSDNGRFPPNPPEQMLKLFLAIVGVGYF